MHRPRRARRHHPGSGKGTIDPGWMAHEKKDREGAAAWLPPDLHPPKTRFRSAAARGPYVVGAVHVDEAPLGVQLDAGERLAGERVLAHVEALVDGPHLGGVHELLRG